MREKVDLGGSGKSEEGEGEDRREISRGEGGGLKIT